MNVWTAYDLDDTVWYLHTWQERLPSTCPTCAGSGEVGIVTNTEGRYITCPDCSYGKVYVTVPELLGEVNRRTIGQVRVEAGEGYVKRTYMCVETGVGPGRLYDEADLYETRENAEQECADLGARLRVVDTEGAQA